MHFRIAESRIRRCFHLVAPKQRFSLAPAATANNLPVSLGNIIGAIGDQLRIDTKDVCDGALDLLGRVVSLTQLPHGMGDELLQRRDVIHHRHTDGNFHRRPPRHQSTSLYQCLRGCLKSSGCREPTQHESRHREVNHGLTTLGQAFIIFTQPA